MAFAAVANLNGALLGDPNLGPVCAECYAWLTIVRATIGKIGARIGIGSCSNDVIGDEQIR